jgi:aspartate-semialdehyde dehydrogenase
VNRLKAGILGATGIVGQQYLRMLKNHPYFEVGGLFASSLSKGKRLKESAGFILTDDIEEFGDTCIEEANDEILKRDDIDLIFSALPSNMGGLEEKLSKKFPVITKSSSHRLDSLVPLIIPEVNPEHLTLIHEQRKQGKTGFISADPNCSTTQLAIPLKALEPFGISTVIVSTMQALSGAGYPGVSSLDASGNVTPYIEGEEEKIKAESAKILGALSPKCQLVASGMHIEAKCARIPVPDGHMENVFIKFKSRPKIEDVKDTLRNFRGPKNVQNLWSSPERPIILIDAPDRPQHRLDLMKGNGMSVVIGSVKESGDFLTFTSLSHNIIRGAAGGGVQHAELLHSEGYL